jgi:hypothetical protein
MVTVSYVECHILALYVECTYVECHYAECCSATLLCSTPLLNIACQYNTSLMTNALAYFAAVSATGKMCFDSTDTHHYISYPSPLQWRILCRVDIHV